MRWRWSWVMSYSCIELWFTRQFSIKKYEKAHVTDTLIISALHTTKKSSKVLIFEWRADDTNLFFKMPWLVSTKRNHQTARKMLLLKSICRATLKLYAKSILTVLNHKISLSFIINCRSSLLPSMFRIKLHSEMNANGSCWVNWREEQRFGDKQVGGKLQL